MQILDPRLAQSYNVAGRIWPAGHIFDTAAACYSVIINGLGLHCL